MQTNNTSAKSQNEPNPQEAANQQQDEHSKQQKQVSPNSQQHCNPSQNLKQDDDKFQNGREQQTRNRAPYDSNYKNSTLGSNKYVSFQTENSVVTSGSARKKYYIKKNVFTQQMLNSRVTHINGPNQVGFNSNSNIFDLTANYSHVFNQIADDPLYQMNTCTYKNSLFQSKVEDTNNLASQNSKQPYKSFNLPIITQSKYNFKPKITMQKIKKKEYHSNAPQYMKLESTIDQRNINKLQKYKNIWAKKSSSRPDLSLLERSVDKAQKYIQKHNSQIYQRKATIEFQTILRNRHIEHDTRIGQAKGVPNRKIQGLKGKGGSVRGLFQPMYAVEEVYKVDK